MHYTFAITPPSDQAAKYIHEAQRLFGDCCKDYLLQHDGTSSPHITLIQFDCDSFDKANEVWLAMKERLDREHFEPFTPPFSGLAFINGTGPYEGTVWAEISVSRGEEDSPIMRAHRSAVEVLESFHLTPLNACLNNFRPHLTYARIIMPKKIKAWSSDVFTSAERFKVAFGQSDTYFQLVKIMESYPPHLGT